MHLEVSRRATLVHLVVDVDALDILTTAVHSRMSTLKEKDFGAFYELVKDELEGDIEQHQYVHGRLMEVLYQLEDTEHDAWLVTQKKLNGV